MSGVKRRGLVMFSPWRCHHGGMSRASPPHDGAPAEDDSGAGIPSVSELEEVAVSAGLSALGVAPVQRFTNTEATLTVRKRAGLHGGMQFTYRSPARSTDPDRALPGARSLVVGALDHLRATPEVPVGVGPLARVARYAWHDHYADLRRGLQAVAAHLDGFGWRTRVLSDDNALVDREAAYRAGLGWYGKNTNLLLEGRGSWFVLGAVLTDAPLPASSRRADGCGTCNRCLPGCPTGAIVAPGVLDARRCLAWIVQAPGPIPRDLRVALHDRLYGCDDCQEVCPPNRRRERYQPPPAEAGSQAWVPALDLLGVDDATLLERYGRWYIAERDPRHLRRNALVVVGNTADPDEPAVIEALRAHCAHPDPLVRSHAAWAARRLGRLDLVTAMRDDPAPEVRAELDAPDPPVR